MSVGLKICGVTRVEDLRDCIELGVDAIGFNLWRQSRRFVDLDRARVLIDAVEWGSTVKVGVFVDASVGEVEAAIASLKLDLIQLHGDAPVGPYAALAARRGIGWIRVIRGTPDLEQLAMTTDALAPAWVLLDAAVPGFGGAGQTTDWDWAAQAVRRLQPRPVWLAGGLGPHNAAQALARVQPAGLDVASGVETAPGMKSPEAIASLRTLCNNSNHP